MATLGTTEKPNPYKAKGKECPTPSMETDVVGSSGDASAVGDSDSTELVQLKKDGENLVSNWASDVPATADDVTQITIDKYFGKNWKGAFPSCETIAIKKKSTIATQFAYYANIADYVMKTLNIGSVNELISSVVPSSVVKMYGHWQQLAQDWSNISMCISNFKEFKFCVENPMAILNSTDAALANLENLVLSVDGALDHLIQFESTLEDIFGKGGIADKLENAVENITQKFSEFSANIVEKLSNLPESVMNAFMNCQFIQNMFSLPRRILAHCASVVAIVTSIRSPTCLKDFVKIIQTLRQAVAEMKNAAAIIQSAVAQVQNIKNMISQGNWVGVLGQLNSGKGAAAESFNIVERPSSFAAKYPANSAYTTHGGHIIELDNTKGHERIHVQHKKGTSVELSPEGDMHSKVKKDFQLMVDGNIEINSNKKITITGKEGVKLDYGGTTFQMDKTSMGMGGQSGNMNVNDFIVTSESARMVSATTLTLGSALETSVSATGLLSLSSAVAVKIQAPSISLIAEAPTGIQMLSAGTIVGVGNGVGFASTINTIIVAAKSGVWRRRSKHHWRWREHYRWSWIR